MLSRRTRMSNSRKAASNRRNALRSTGPKTKGGKDRSSLNAIRHGLSARPLADEATQDRIANLAKLFALGLEDDKATSAFAEEAAEAQVILERVRHLRSLVWEEAVRNSAKNDRGAYPGRYALLEEQKPKEEFDIEFQGSRKTSPYSIVPSFAPDVERDVAISEQATEELSKYIRYERQAANRRDRALRCLEGRQREVNT